MNKKKLKEFLDSKYDKYNSPEFIKTDPVAIPHLFYRKEDIEIAAFLSATIAWGQRTTIIKNATRLMEWLEMSPYEYITNAGINDLRHFQKFSHRTFNGDDCLFFLKSLARIYRKHGSLENVFSQGYEKDKTIRTAIIHFRKVFLEPIHETRVEKHVSNPEKNSASKKINLFLRWMVRNDNRGVDFGLWKKIPSSALYCPLDVHSANVSRKLGLLHRKQNDWDAVSELTENLGKLDPADPVKYDFALFGLGIFEKF